MHRHERNILEELHSKHSLSSSHTHTQTLFQAANCQFLRSKVSFPHHILLVMRIRHVHPLLHTDTRTLLVRAYMLLPHARPFKLNTGVSKGQTRSKSQHRGLPSSKSYRQSQAGTTRWIAIKCHHLCPICVCGRVLHGHNGLHLSQNGLQITYLSAKWLNVQDALVKWHGTLSSKMEERFPHQSFCECVCAYFVCWDECDIVGTYCASWFM